MQVVNISGNQDLCYYNFLCANPGVFLNDFNHVFSNIGYILIGILYVVIVIYRQTAIRPLKVNTGLQKVHRQCLGWVNFCLFFSR